MDTMSIIISLFAVTFFALGGIVFFYVGVKKLVKLLKSGSQKGSWFICFALGLACFFMCYRVVVPSKWNCPECQTYQAAINWSVSGSAQNRYFVCINCDKRFKKVDKFRDGKPFYSLP